MVFYPVIKTLINKYNVIYSQLIIFQDSGLKSKLKSWK